MKREYSNEEYCDFARRVVAGLVRRTAEGDMEDLRRTSALFDEFGLQLEDAIDELNDDGSPAGYSWREIGQALGISRSTAHNRFARRGAA